MSDCCYNIRPVRENDAAAIAGIQQEAWQISYRGIMRDDFLDKLSVSEHKIGCWQQKIVQAEYFIVAEDEAGEVVGYLQAGRGRFNHVPYPLEIYSFYVHPNCQCQQIGRSLFRKFLSDFGDVSFYVCVAKGNRAAENFYQKCGGRLVSDYDFVSATNKFPVAEEVFVWGTPGVQTVLHCPGDRANPEFW